MVLQCDCERVEEGNDVFLCLDITLVGVWVGFLFRDVKPDGSCDVACQGGDLVPFGTPLPPAGVGGRHAEGNREGDNKAGV